LAARGRGRDRRSLEAARSLSRVDACNPLLQAHPTWARDEHEGRGISTSLTPISGHLTSPLRARPRVDPSGLGHAATFTRRLRDPRSRNADTRYQGPPERFGRRPMAQPFHGGSEGGIGSGWSSLPSIPKGPLMRPKPVFIEFIGFLHRPPCLFFYLAILRHLFCCSCSLP
jgi:hypothetical protein